jgi:formate dehydrogenase major subunit
MTIEFFIDGKKAVAKPGETILKVAERMGISIPTLCHNKKISHTTSCFVCVIKDAKTGRYLPSCSALPNPGQEVLSNHKEVLEMRKTALDLLLSEHSGDCEAPCTVSCPAHAQVEEYVREGKNGNFLESLKIIKKRIPLPMSIGRVCPRFCEKDCRRNVKDEAVAINEFKRLAADLHYTEYLEELPPLTGEKVAIIGAGPAGLATAYYLRLEGVASDLYESMPKAGGMLRYGIPEYRLPKDILDKEIAHWEKMGGITIICNQKVTDDKLVELKRDYKAVATTIGCWQASSMRCEGDDLASNGIEWLENIARQGWSGENPGKTLVIGGGNTAMDCVRTSIRLGSESVNCLYRRTEAEMPAEKIEIKEAKEEGANFNFLLAPVKLEKIGDKLHLTCQKMELGEPDASGRRRPIPIVDSEFVIEADTVIAAIGQKTKAISTMKINRWGNIDAAESNLQVENNVFAAGDCVTGAATVVEAVAGGRKVALAMTAFLRNQPHSEPNLINVSRGHWRSLSTDDLVFLENPNDLSRLEMPIIDINERKTTFKEVMGTVKPEQLTEEGSRCFECSCTSKGDCKLKAHSEEYGAKPEAIAGEKAITGYDNRHPAIIHDRMKCIKCGICIKICSEVINENLLGLKNRGFTSTVATAFDEVLPNSCTQCGACVAECPVGALDLKQK